MNSDECFGRIEEVLAAGAGVLGVLPRLVRKVLIFDCFILFCTDFGLF